MNNEKWELLQNEIHTKCVTYDYIDATDSTLSEFIVNLVQVGKSPEEVDQELSSLVGSDYDPNVTRWIFTRKQELENSLTTQQSEPQPEPKQDEQPMETSEPPKNRIFSRALGRALNNDSRSEPSRRYQSSRREDRSRSRSPIRSSTRYERDNHRYTSERRHDTRDSQRSGDVFSRVGPQENSQSDRPSVFDRLGGSKPVVIPPRSLDEPKKKERCKYWPACKNGKECPFFHPTKMCPDFPNCPKKASECTFIHPETSQPVIQPPVMNKLPIPCKFFPYCNNPVCPYVHPIVAPQQQAFFMQAQSSFTQQRVQVPCKNGDACTRPDCHFLHPKDPNPLAEVICKYDGACTRPNCFYKHTKENNAQSKVFANRQIDTSSRQFSVPEDQVDERITVGQSADLIPQQHTMEVDRDVVMDAS
ncbi:hypothetical protein EDC96DRAFT_313110 [Choanephora cucurbitarum]|nr:hypothetical protein EDC96DRAFT_313110 [Choanephora cucurbitarum]